MSTTAPVSVVLELELPDLRAVEPWLNMALGLQRADWHIDHFNWFLDTTVDPAVRRVRVEVFVRCPACARALMGKYPYSRMMPSAF